MLFSQNWAQSLMNRFAQIPVLSSDPFEFEWWVRSTQAEYESHKPDETKLPQMAQRKAREGSASTLSSMTISAIRQASVTAQLSTIGDSCIFVGDTATQTVRCFHMQNASQFNNAPICIHSLQRKFNRAYHQWKTTQVELHTNMTVILATDALARWLLSHTDEKARWLAFQGLAGITKKTWEAFIVGCRYRNEMVDDDTTALIIRFSAGRNGHSLSVTPSHATSVINERQKVFAQAAASGDKELMAITYGNGGDFKHTPYKISQATIQDARIIADALNEVRQTYFNSLTRRNTGRDIEQVWRKHEELFHKNDNRVSVEKLLRMLQANGVLQEISLPSGPSSFPTRTPADSSSEFLLWLSGVIRALLRIGQP